MIEITTITFTNDALINQYISTFVYITAVLVSFFGAFSLMGR